MQDAVISPLLDNIYLHPEKTHVGDCRQSGEGFDFLGYRFMKSIPAV
jgi:hypothetical protein